MPQLGDMREVFERAGAMAELLLDFDWASTPLGIPSEWPQSLRSAASICLSAKYPIAIYWGDELTLLYNEAWSAIPRDRHPWALGRPGAEVWTDIWDIVSPDFDRARAGEGVWTEDTLLPMVRHGVLEENYFNYNLSPITAEDGRIEGVFNAGIEVTHRVLSDRRNRLLIGVAAHTGKAMTVDGACTLAADALAVDPSLVPFALMYLFDDPSSARLVATTALEPGSEVAPVDVDLRDGPDLWALGEVRRSRRAAVLDDLRERAGEMPAGTWTEPPRTAVTLPIVLGGLASRREVFGAVVVGIPAGQRVDEYLVDFLDLLTEHLASALLTARLDEEERRVFHTEHEIATTLQRSLIPELPDVPGVVIDGRYLPGSAEVEVGGDWYDAVPLPDGRLALVIGDVVGKGVAAAAHMGQLRNAVRAYLLEGFSPSEVITKLNRLSLSLTGTGFATVVCLHHDPSTGAVAWCRAGHPPPLVRRADGRVEYLDGAGSPPIAVFDDATFSESADRLDPGDLLVLYTDGLVERRGEEIDVGLARLAEHVADVDPTADAAGRVVGALRDDDRRDDIAVVTVFVPS